MCGVCVCVVCVCLCVCMWCVECGMCFVMCVRCVCVCACLSVRLFRNHEHSRIENFQKVSVGDAYLIIMLPQILLRPTV